MQFPERSEAEQVREAFGSGGGNLFSYLSAHTIAQQAVGGENKKRSRGEVEKPATDGGSSNSNNHYRRWIDDDAKWDSWP